MAWDVVGTQEFEDWYLALDDQERARVADRVDLLEQLGSALGRPVVDSIKASRHHHMKELRAGSIRILFAFDPTSSAVLLLGGDKRNNWSEWYDAAIRHADDLYDAYLTDTKEQP